MPPAYYKNNTDEGVFNFYSFIISKVPKIKIILYNFEKLSLINFLQNLLLNLLKLFLIILLDAKTQLIIYLKI